MGDPTLTLDTVLKFAEIASILGGGVLIAFRVGAVSTRVEETLKKQNEIITEMKNDMKKLTDVLSQLSVQENRLDRIEDDIRDLRRGRGYIVEDRPVAPNRGG